MTDVIVTFVDGRAVQFCATGMRAYCKKYSLNYSDFVINGIEASKLLAATNNDYLACQAVEKAYERVKKADDRV